MNLTNLFGIQKKLNERIIEEHGLHYQDLLPEQILALKVEMSELANETRCFKYWSKKPPSAREQILEEYVDGLHFILSVGLLLDMQRYNFERVIAFTSDTLTDQFLKIEKNIIKLYDTKDFYDYVHLLGNFAGVGKMLGFTWDEIEAAYMRKNAVNHQRQDEGY